MPSFLKDISGFYGTGEKNRAGQTLEEFLEAYDPYKYRTPSCTTDAVIFAYPGESVTSVSELKVLLVKRSNHPSIGYWALPGGFIELKENLEETAHRELLEETGVKGLVMEQLGTYGDYDRDPRARVITTAYMALVQESQVKVRAGDDAADAVWCSVSIQKLEEAFQEEKKGQTLYKITVENVDRDLHTEAVVEENITERWPIREKSYKVRKQGEIAVDHAAMITEALLKLGRRIEKRK